jgi:hypothetical protein
LIVLADIDDDLENGEQLKQKYWETAQVAGISKEIFEKAVFIFSNRRRFHRLFFCRLPA